MATKKTGVTVTIIRAGYYQGDELVEPGKKVTVPKAEAMKLVARGIAEEK